jgi:hypothetical protein
MNSILVVLSLKDRQAEMKLDEQRRYFIFRNKFECVIVYDEVLKLTFFSAAISMS